MSEPTGNIYIALIEKKQAQRTEAIELWANKQVKSDIIPPIKEMLLLHTNFVSDMYRMRAMLDILKKNGQLTPTESNDISTCLKNTDNLLASIEHWERKFPYIPNQNTQVNEFIESLPVRFNHDNYGPIASKLELMLKDEAIINAVYKPRAKLFFNHNQMKLASGAISTTGEQGMPRDLSFFTATPKQYYMTKITMPLEKIAKKLPDEMKNYASTAYKNITSMVQNTNQKVAQESEARNEMNAFFKKLSAKKPAEQKALILRDMLNPQQHQKYRACFTEYLQNALIQVEPGIFNRDIKGNLQLTCPNTNIAGNQKHMIIYEALKFSPLDIKNQFNPAQFNIEKLDALYKMDKNPLWIVLKTLKPVDEKTFTAKQKIDNYKEVVDALKDSKIGAKDKYKVAYEVIKAAHTVIKEHPNWAFYVKKCFGTGSEYGKWIIDKQASKQEKAEVCKVLDSPQIPTSPITKTFKDALQSTKKLADPPPAPLSSRKPRI